MAHNLPAVFAVGLNYETAPLEIRERAAVDPNETALALDELIQKGIVDEALILSTCNRTEVYAFSSNQWDIIKWMSDKCSGLASSDLGDIWYVHKGVDAFKHAVRVASGMDSMVLGETQILGQLKDAYRRAEAAGTLGPNLHKLFQSAFMVAKEIRTKTEIGAHSISLAAAAAKASQRIFSNLADTSILFIGAGEMIRLCAEHFSKFRFKQMSFANRTISNAEILARLYGAKAFDLQSIESRIASYDIVVSCTASPIAILGKGVVEGALVSRKHKPIVIFDLAVPRDVEMGIAQLDDVFLYSIDDLGNLIDQGRSNRQDALGEAEQILARREIHFADWLSNQQTVPVIKSLHEFGNDLVSREFFRGTAALANGEDAEKILRSALESIKNKLLDRPSRSINAAVGDDKKKTADMVAKIFDLGKK